MCTVASRQPARIANLLFHKSKTFVERTNDETEIVSLIHDELWGYHATPTYWIRGSKCASTEYNVAKQNFLSYPFSVFSQRYKKEEVRNLVLEAQQNHRCQGYLGRLHWPGSVWVEYYNLEEKWLKG